MAAIQNKKHYALDGVRAHDNSLSIIIIQVFIRKINN